MGTDDAFFGVCAEIKELQDFGSLRQIGADLFKSIGRSKTAAVVKTVDVLDDRDGFGIETCADQTDLVDHFYTAVASFCHHEGGDVLTEYRSAGNDRKTSDPAELVQTGKSGKQYVVKNFAVTGSCSVSDKNDIIADFTVVGNMGAVHEHIVITDDGAGVRLGSGVDGASFAEDVVVTDLEIGGFAGFNGVILCRLPQSGERMDQVFFTESGMSVYVAVTDETGSFTDGDVGADKTERTDFNSVSEDGSF